eukprot:TRINITY_DN2201_c0_g2_i4.p1 TRINITY_DN2201_c0_g2~~TRINITY_DN2201_c0_g2_i4.p1  ORF type:complete len:394 (-),score=78.96 TRINITY_DN2201_c0_g2_i4:349-1530(-)
MSRTEHVNPPEIFYSKGSSGINAEYGDPKLRCPRLVCSDVSYLWSMKRERGESEDSDTEREEKKLKLSDSEYFESYAHLDIHEEMIRDSIRTNTYRNAMLQNPSDFKDKIVLDVGCGTGILSIFAVQAGAKHVYAVDASNVIEVAKELVKHNNLSNKITFIRGRIEDVYLPVLVDVIVSEWMGYFLVYESMLQSVLFARDRWLKKQGGKMYPSLASIWLSPFMNETFYSERINFWSGNMFGIDFTPVREHAKKRAFLEAHVEALGPEAELSFPTKVLTIDIGTDSYQDIKNFVLSFTTKTILKGSMHGIMGYFTVDFVGTDKTITLSTGPCEEPTHWQQTLFFFEDPVPVSMDSSVTCCLSVAPMSCNPRFLCVNLDCEVDGKYHVKQKYQLK